MTSESNQPLTGTFSGGVPDDSQTQDRGPGKTFEDGASLDGGGSDLTGSEATIEQNWPESGRPFESSTSNLAAGDGGYTSGVPGTTVGGYTTTGQDSTSGPVAKAGEAASEVKDVAAAKAGEVKDHAVQRGSDVAAVAKDELANVAGEFRDQLQALWGQASGQLREQAGTGKQQLADLLHSLAGELGEMSSKSEQGGPLTAFARNAAVKGGEWSHWLSEVEPSEVLTELRRFARRRPFFFLAGAAVTGIVVGRLSRSLAANSSESTASGPSTFASSGYPTAGSPRYATGYGAESTPGYTPTSYGTAASSGFAGTGSISEGPSGYASDPGGATGAGLNYEDTTVSGGALDEIPTGLETSDADYLDQDRTDSDHLDQDRR